MVYTSGHSVVVRKATEPKSPKEGKVSLSAPTQPSGNLRALRAGVSVEDPGDPFPRAGLRV